MQLLKDKRFPPSSLVLDLDLKTKEIENVKFYGKKNIL